MKIFDIFKKSKKSDSTLKKSATQTKSQEEVQLTKEQKKQAHKRAKEIDKLNSKPKGTKSIPNAPGLIIEVKNASKFYTNKILIFPAITDVNFSIKKGEFVVILGPSGSGKSTLLNIMSGLDRPTSGEIVINGTNIVALSDSELTKFRRNNTGFIFQSYNLLPSLNVVENAKIGQSLQSNKEKRLPMDEVLEEIGIITQAKKKINEISGGQQQRVSIARAISKNPLILFADEPTGALDEQSAKSVLQLFEKISKKHGMTTVLVTHDPKIATLADKIIRVKNNKIDSVTINKNKVSAADL